VNDIPTGFTHNQLASLIRKRLAGFKNTPQQNGAVINVFLGKQSRLFLRKGFVTALTPKQNPYGFSGYALEADIHMPSPRTSMKQFNTDCIRKQT
jgi:hypothetical protein